MSNDRARNRSKEDQQFLAESRRLVEAAQAGDTASFGQLWDHYRGPVFHFIRYRVSDPVLAADLTSDTFVRAFHRLSHYTWQGTDIGAWFITIARNLVADHYKSGRYRFEVISDAVGGHGTDLATTRVLPSAEDAVLEQMSNVELYRAIRSLTGDQQRCLVLRFLHEKSVAATASEMGINPGACKALQYRAIQTLRRRFGAELGVAV